MNCMERAKHDEARPTRSHSQPSTSRMRYAVALQRTLTARKALQKCGIFLGYKTSTRKEENGLQTLACSGKNCGHALAKIAGIPKSCCNVVVIHKRACVCCFIKILCTNWLSDSRGQHYAAAFRFRFQCFSVEKGRSNSARAWSPRLRHRDTGYHPIRGKDI